MTASALNHHPGGVSALFDAVLAGGEEVEAVTYDSQARTYTLEVS